MARVTLLELADRLHLAAIYLVRDLRREGERGDLSTAQLSALSVLIRRGPMPLGELARCERVRPPTMTRLVQNLERSGHVVRHPDPDDGRIVHLAATHRAWQALEESRARRVEALRSRLEGLDRDERRTLQRAVALLERLSGDPRGR